MYFPPSLANSIGLLPPNLLSSRYVTVNQAAGRALFYTLVESTTSPDTAPLVLWLNGGPGCSSMGSGFMSELGPFYPTASGQLVRNEYAWNKVANMVFLDSPAFVGWSYSNRTSDIKVGDKRTAQDTLAFLLGFLERFPQYKQRVLWLSGESYAGHYIPNLAYDILQYNKAAASDAKLNFKGFLVGEPMCAVHVDMAALSDSLFASLEGMV